MTSNQLTRRVGATCGVLFPYTLATYNPYAAPNFSTFLKKKKAVELVFFFVGCPINF